MDHLISIIVPVYNSEKFLSTCIDSILVQTYTNFEILLVNDGSTDGSATICETYAMKDKRIRVFHKKNAGVSATRNFGIRQANGYFITFVDSDDKVQQSFLSDFKTDEQNADFYVQGGVLWTSENEFQKVYISHENQYYDNIAKIIESLDIEYRILESPWGKLFKKQILCENLHFFNEELFKSEDHLFVMGYFRFISSLYICNTCNYFYRKFDNHSSLSQQFTPHDKIYLYADLVFRVRMEIIHKHQMSNRYVDFSINVHHDLISKSLMNLFESRNKTSNSKKGAYIKKYLLEIENLAHKKKLRKIKKIILIKLIWKSYFPFRIAILNGLLSRK